MTKAAMATERIESAGRSNMTPSSIMDNMSQERSAGDPPPLIAR